MSARKIEEKIEEKQNPILQQKMIRVRLKLNLDKLGTLFRHQIQPLSTESTSSLSLEFIRKRLSKFNAPDYLEKRLTSQPRVKKRASVLIPISIQQRGSDSQPRTYFTLSKRTDLLSSHKGEVCFLGGKKDANESDVETAYREAREEANLEASSLTFLAQLCPIISYQGILVTPVVAFFDKTNFKQIINTKEVEMVFDLPTERFLSNEAHKTKTITNAGGSYLIHYFKDNIDNDKTVTTWGMTAFLAIVVSSLLHAREPDFDVTLEKKVDIQRINEYLEKFLFSKLLVAQAADRENKNKTTEKS